MTIMRAAAVILMVGLVSSCSTLPHCYSTTATKAANTQTKSCPAWMCNIDGRNTECVTNIGGSEVPVPNRRSRSLEQPEVVSPQEMIVLSEPVAAPEPVAMLEPEPQPEAVALVMESEPENVMPADLDAAPVGTFALQVAAMSSKISATKFVANRSLDGAQIIAVESDGITVYAVVNGYFESREEGAAAADAFRASYGGPAPWVRRVEEMRESRERLSD